VLEELIDFGIGDITRGISAVPLLSIRTHSASSKLAQRTIAVCIGHCRNAIYRQTILVLLRTLGRVKHYANAEEEALFIDTSFRGEVLMLT
jgi:hypothetical protein